MSTIRRGALPSDHFTIISNAWLRDERLPWAARGLLAWMASHTDDYDITEDAIVAAGPSGRAAVKVMILALQEAGYLRRERTSLITGGSTVDYVLTDPESENRTPARVRKSNPRADQGEQAPEDENPQVSPNVGKSNPRSSLEDQKKTKTPSVSKTATGTRLPEDFIPTPEMREWFAEEKLHLVLDARIEHEKFVNYWVGCPGVRGRKLNWPRTWKNWMWTQAERAPRRPGTALAPVSGAPYSKTNDRVMQGLALAEKFRQMEENQ
jgi:hypothetical protein